MSPLLPPLKVSSARSEKAIELEAVVSCAFDGLVVCLREARPILPTTLHPHAYTNGLFAAPWGPETAHLPGESQSSLMQTDFMSSIRDVAAFAWALTGSNGELRDYMHGKPMGNAQPSPQAFPTWSPAYCADSTSL